MSLFLSPCIFLSLFSIWTRRVPVTAHTGPPFRLLPSLSLSLLPLSLSFSLSLPPARIPTAARTRCVPPRHTHTHTRHTLTHTYMDAHTHTHTLTPANGRSRKCLIPVLEWCHYAGLTGRLQDLSAERESETQGSISQLTAGKSRNRKGETIALSLNIMSLFQVQTADKS